VLKIRRSGGDYVFGDYEFGDTTSPQLPLPFCANSFCPVIPHLENGLVSFCLPKGDAPPKPPPQ